MVCVGSHHRCVMRTDTHNVQLNSSSKLFYPVNVAFFSPQFSGEERESLSSMRKMVSSWTASGGGGGEEGRGAQAKAQSQPARIGPRPGPSREEESGPVIGPMLPSMMVRCVHVCSKVHYYVEQFCT